jgi:hypothetical protein
MRESSLLHRVEHKMRDTFSNDDTAEDQNNRAEFLIFVVKESSKKVADAFQLKAFRDLLEQGDIMKDLLVDISLNIDAFFLVKVLELDIYHRIYYSFGNLRLY